MTKNVKVFIGNIPFNCRESDIHSFFIGYGRIRQVVLKNNYGFCEFLDYEDAKAAVKELNGERLLGRNLGNYLIMLIFVFCSEKFSLAY